jgi:protein TonB
MNLRRCLLATALLVLSCPPSLAIWEVGADAATGFAFVINTDGHELRVLPSLGEDIPFRAVFILSDSVSHAFGGGTLGIQIDSSEWSVLPKSLLDYDSESNSVTWQLQDDLLNGIRTGESLSLRFYPQGERNILETRFPLNDFQEALGRAHRVDPVVILDLPDEIVIPPPPKGGGPDSTQGSNGGNPDPIRDLQDRMTFPAFDTPPTVVKQVLPEYPEAARMAEEEGEVFVIVAIDLDGRVMAARVESSNASADLERAAIEAAEQWEFRPAKQGDVAVNCMIVLPFEFSLE